MDDCVGIIHSQVLKSANNVTPSQRDLLVHNNNMDEHHGGTRGSIIRQRELEERGLSGTSA
jgi:hypothetical protein